MQGVELSREATSDLRVVHSSGWSVGLGFSLPGKQANDNGRGPA
jgi:hypothetical protein